MPFVHALLIVALENNCCSSNPSISTPSREHPSSHPNLLVSLLNGFTGAGTDLAELHVPDLELVSAMICAPGKQVKRPTVLRAGDPSAQDNPKVLDIKEAAF